jgi:uncharacterized protein
MTKQDQINENIKEAMKGQLPVLLGTLRTLKNAFTNASLQKGNANLPLSDEEVMVIIRKQIKQREDSVEQFKKGNRSDLVAREEAEISILSKYLPTQLSDAEVDAIVAQAIADTGAVSKKDMGKAIKRAVELASGGVDNKTLSTKIGSKL